MNKYGVIYCVKSPSGKVYIGKSKVGLKKRMAEHIRASRRKKTALGFAIKKYGDDLVWCVLYEGVPLDLLDAMEITVIAWYDARRQGYNCTLGGDGGAGACYSETEILRRSKLMLGNTHALGLKLSDDVKRKMSVAKKGHIVSAETRQKLRDANLGKKLTDETRQKISAANKGKNAANKNFLGRRHTEDTKKKMSLAQRKRPPITDETRKKMSEAQKLRAPPNLETRRRQSESHKIWWAKKKNVNS